MPNRYPDKNCESQANKTESTQTLIFVKAEKDDTERLESFGVSDYSAVSGFSSEQDWFEKANKMRKSETKLRHESNKKGRKSKHLQDENKSGKDNHQEEIEMGKNMKKKKEKKRKKDKSKPEEDYATVHCKTGNTGFEVARLESGRDVADDYKKTKKKKKNKQSLHENVKDSNVQDDVTVNSLVQVKVKKKKKKKHGHAEENTKHSSSGKEKNAVRTKDVGKEKRKKRKKSNVKASKMTDASQDNVDEDRDIGPQVTEDLGGEAKKKKKRKRADFEGEQESTYARQHDIDEDQNKGHQVTEMDKVGREAKKKKKRKMADFDGELDLSDARQDSTHECNAGDGDHQKKKKKHKHKKDKMIERNDLHRLIQAKKRKAESATDEYAVKKKKIQTRKVEEENNKNEGDLPITSVKKRSSDEVKIDQARRLALQGEIDRESGRIEDSKIKPCTMLETRSCLEEQTMPAVEESQSELTSPSSQEISLRKQQRRPESMGGEARQQMLAQSLKKTLNMLRANMDQLWVELDQMLELMNSGSSPRTINATRPFTELYSDSLVQDLLSTPIIDSQSEGDSESSPLSRSTLLPAVSPQIRGFGLLPDIELVSIPEHKERELVTMSCGKPERLAVLLFKELVPISEFIEWSNRVNWDGTRGKMAIPSNLHVEIMRVVGRHFKIGKTQMKNIKQKVNELLRKPRKRNIVDFLRNIQEHIQSFQISTPETMNSS